MVDEYPGNSNRGKDAGKLKPVVRGQVGRRKRPLGQRIADNIVDNDSRTVGSYIVFDVLLPAAKQTIVEAVTAGAERMFLGDSRGFRRSSGPSRYGNSSYTPYHNVGQRAPEPRQLSRQNRAAQNYDELLYDSRAEASEVLDQLYELLSEYGVVTVANLLDLSNFQSSHTDTNFGWTSLHGSQVTRTRHGDYVLNLPKPKPLD